MLNLTAIKVSEIREICPVSSLGQNSNGTRTGRCSTLNTMQISAVPGFLNGAFGDSHADDNGAVSRDGAPIGLAADGAGGFIGHTNERSWTLVFLSLVEKFVSEFFLYHAQIKDWALELEFFRRFIPMNELEHLI